MADAIVLDEPLTWRQVAVVADGAALSLSDTARARIANSRRIVEALIERNIRGYGINTGVGALCDVVIDREKQQALSRNIVMSHAAGVGAPLGRLETRVQIAAMINNYALGASGIRLETVEALLSLLTHDCVPVVPSQGSVGYLSHAASIALVLIGAGHAVYRGERVAGAAALAAIGLKPLVLEAKEGLSLVNGTTTAVGLASLALDRLRRLLDWADAAAAMTYENLGSQPSTFAAEPLALHRSPGLQTVGKSIRDMLRGSAMLAETAGRRTQDPISLRAVPHLHGAARDVFDHVAEVVDRELHSVSDNPAVGGTVSAPVVHSEAHAMGPALGLALDSLANAAAQLTIVSERRIDRLVNPLVSGLPAFLVADSGVCSGFMIAQYTATALAAENRRLAMPASLDGGITSGLQEDVLTHAVPAAMKVLAILANVEQVLAIELLAACQAYDLQPATLPRASATDTLYRAIRAYVPLYADDRPLGDDMETVRARIVAHSVTAVRSGSPSGITADR